MTSMKTKNTKRDWKMDQDDEQHKHSSHLSSSSSSSSSKLFRISCVSSSLVLSLWLVAFAWSPAPFTVGYSFPPSFSSSSRIGFSSRTPSSSSSSSLIVSRYPAFRSSDSIRQSATKTKTDAEPNPTKAKTNHNINNNNNNTHQNPKNHQSDEWGEEQDGVVVNVQQLDSRISCANLVPNQGTGTSKTTRTTTTTLPSPNRYREPARVIVRPGPGASVTKISGSGSVLVARCDHDHDHDKNDDNDNDANMKEENDNPDTKHETNKHPNSTPEKTRTNATQRKAAAAALLLQTTQRSSKPTKTKTKTTTTRSRRSETSVGSLRVGSASRARNQRGPLAGRILGSVRTAASAAAQARVKSRKESREVDGGAGDSGRVEGEKGGEKGAGDAKEDGWKDGGATMSGEDNPQPREIRKSQPNLKKSVIASAIDTLLQSQNDQRRHNQQQQQQHPPNQTFKSPPSMGLLGERTTQPLQTQPLSPSPPLYSPRPPPSPLQLQPDPGSILVHRYPQPFSPNSPPSSSSSPFTTTTPHSPPIKVRTALPTDDPAIANLRLSVFSNFAPDLRHQYCQRSCEILNGRRDKGATCLVACVDRDQGGKELDDRRARNRHGHGHGHGHPLDQSNPNEEWVLGSVECSTHEFAGTELGRQRPGGSLLYVTEVAVSPRARKCGVGTMLMKGVDKLATIRNVETIYLHVDVTNDIACQLYQKAGYQILDKHDPIYHDFTTSLNLQDGATKGRNHYLLYKHLVDHPTWLEPSEQVLKAGGGGQGTLGFEI